MLERGVQTECEMQTFDRTCVQVNEENRSNRFLSTIASQTANWAVMPVDEPTPILLVTIALLFLALLLCLGSFAWKRRAGFFHLPKRQSINGTQEHRDRIARKQKFLACAGNKYGYATSPSKFIDDWRPRELPQLITPISSQYACSASFSEDEQIEQKEVYLDYAGSALPTVSQLKALNEQSSRTILANPHSTGIAASRTSLLIELANKRVLDFFHANPGICYDGQKKNVVSVVAQSNHPGYDLVYTSGATDSLRIVAERFPWFSCDKCGRRSILVYPQSVHTSVIGMRGPAMSKGAHFVCKSLDDLVNDMQDDTCMNKWSNLPDFSCLECNDISLHHLIVLPSECNFGGDRPDVSSIIKRARELSTGKVRYSVMLDIAKGASTGPVDLCKIDPDFSCLSFYKLFGEPTGLGCLFVKRSSIGILMESTTHMYFGGGSVDAVLPTLDFVSPRSEPTPLASLSNGTSHFRGIASLINGFDELGRLGGMEQVRLHTNSLVSELLRRFRNLHHRDGGPVIELYGAWRFYKGDDATCAPGPTIAFNILRANGSNVGYNEVSKLAALNKPPLQLRTGCFCNPGACQLALQITNDAAISNYQNSGHVCGDSIDLINGKPTGCIRCSFGKESIWEDLDELVTFIDHMFVSSTDRATIVESDSLPDRRPREVVVSELYLFPIKSCAAQKVHRWKMAKASGKLLLDREFALVDSLGRAMRLQVFPQMSLIRPTIDLDTQTMHVVAPGCTPLVINLKDTRMTRIETERDNCFVKVCGSSQCCGEIWGDQQTAEWFSDFLGVRCWLARFVGGAYQPIGTHLSADKTPPQRSAHVAFANEEPLLLISEHAVAALNQVLGSRGQGQVSSCHFRPNIVVRPADVNGARGGHIEDGWSRLEFIDKNMAFDVAGPCSRCSMVDVDPTSGMKGNTLETLADYRRNNGQITFGIFLRSASIDKIGDADRVISLEEGDVISCQ